MSNNNNNKKEFSSRISVALIGCIAADLKKECFYYVFISKKGKRRNVCPQSSAVFSKDKVFYVLFHKKTSSKIML